MPWLKRVLGLLAVTLASVVAFPAEHAGEHASPAEHTPALAKPSAAASTPAGHAGSPPVLPKKEALPKDELAALNATEVKTIWDSLTNDFAKTSRPVEPRPKPRASGNPSDVALRNSPEHIASTNVLADPGEPGTDTPSDKYQTLLKEALEHRQNKDTARAARVLVAILLAEAPEEIQRSALLELALLAQQENQALKAQQIFSQYVRRFAEDPSVPEVLLRQGLL